ncbi:short-chain dehydrogenase [Colletotrichum scovillei]|uniref:Short-chain dehydrogenase/reductase 3 n=1 Tax=Colletotrichum scovillei TaxID=1209932 RepID=A0A9P7R7W9_9PEZI|nr:short-chain dehydrogenase [Colletotrichum scovillei]KAF4781855.1 short-chain dehydrogenase [Colletotrichum scovillei]KAG7050544.1 short-chain dehydrogenase [Colletotrichum scovillei]KAG7069587.1 short-chain dehydrogenase [Colletotrichum scovillei]KAG7073591.1 short-chain dehydrogenase [Colletotrichum scovillei]
MPLHQGFLPREGLTADPIFRLLARTALNPSVLLPLLLLARYTKKGGDLAILHPTAFSRIKFLAYCAVTRWASSWLSRRALNNWVDDRYDWRREIVLVTGGAGGIGGHVARLLAEQGATVVVLDIQDLTFTAASNVHYFKCDITSTEKLAAVANDIRAKVGHPTVLINNAGVARGKTVLDSTERDIRFTFDVNTLAHYWTTKEFLPHMAKMNHGMIVTVASYASYLCVPNMVDYGASKAAAMAFHEGITAELTTRYNAPRVRTVLVNQGFTKTPLFTGYEQGVEFIVPALEPETVADAVVRQVLAGESGHVVLPAYGNVLTALRAFPYWYQHRIRGEAQKLMKNFSGRQVVKDVEGFYEKRDKKAEEEQERPEESTVLVAEPIPEPNGIE